MIRRRMLLAALISVLGLSMGGTAFAADPALVGTWRLLDFRSSSDQVGTKTPAPEKTFEMTLGMDGRVEMQLDCNRAHGTWQSVPGADGRTGQLTFGPLAMTRALCAPPNLDEFIARQTDYIRGYLLKETTLHLSLMADGGILSWQRMSGTEAAPFAFAAPEDGGPRNWRVATAQSPLNLRAEPSSDAEILTAYPPGTLLDNLGCRDDGGRIWCDVQQVGGGKRGFVAATFLRPAISPNGHAMFGPDLSALRAGQKQFDATGQVPCTVAGQPGSCPFSVARSGGGYAAVVIQRPGGYERVIYFTMGRAIGAGMSEADNPGPFSHQRDGDLTLIRLGAESYTIPDAVVRGG